MQHEFIPYEKLLTLREKISDELIANERTLHLTSNSSDSMLRDKIKYFLSFLIRAQQEENPDVLYAILPWMYHAYHAQGFANEYFLLELEVIEKFILDYFDTPIREDMVRMLQEIQQNHAKFILMAQSYHSASQEIPTEYQKMYELFKEALFAGDSIKSKNIFQNGVKNYHQLQNFYEYVIVPSMTEIGIAWENGIITPAEEHLASAIIIENIALLYTKLEVPSYYKGKGVVGAVTNEYHELGAMMLANSLEIDGWDVEYLGPNVPDQLFLDTIEKYAPKIVALSVAMPFNISYAKELIKKIHQLSLKKIPHIMIGGSAFIHNEDAKKACKADSYLQNVDDGVKQANFIYEEDL